MKLIKFSFTLLFSALFVFIANPVLASPQSPLINDLNPSLKSFDEPFLTGYTDKYSTVLVYIDGVYYGDAKTNTIGNKTVFNYFLNKLPSDGEHSVFAVARDINGVLSAPGNEYDFFINRHLDSPEIIKKSDGLSIKSANQNYINVYLNGALFEKYYIERNARNILNLNYSTFPSGENKVFVIARDKTGRVSPKSREFLVYGNNNINESKQNNSKPWQTNTDKETYKEQKPPQISEKAATDSSSGEEIVVEGVDNIEDGQSEKDRDDVSSSSIEEIIDTDKQENEKIASGTGMLDESGNQQNNIRWNFFIFLAFLLAVILWIIWVNKEGSEDKERGEAEDDSSETR